jgi:hypothetical protein
MKIGPCSRIDLPVARRHKINQMDLLKTSRSHPASVWCPPPYVTLDRNDECGVLIFPTLGFENDFILKVSLNVVGRLVVAVKGRIA